MCVSVCVHACACALQELSSELVYNVSQDVSRAAILVISQVEEHRVQVTLTLTSTEMRETLSPEQIQGMCSHLPVSSLSVCISDSLCYVMSDPLAAY